MVLFLLRIDSTGAGGGGVLPIAHKVKGSEDRVMYQIKRGMFCILWNVGN